MFSRGYNLIQDATSCEIVGSFVGVITGTAPLLGPLQDNGGDTLTRALLAGSPALNAGNNASCEAVDQRGIVRPQPRHDFNGQRARCDIGAFELEVPMYDIYLPMSRR